MITLASDHLQVVVEPEFGAQILSATVVGTANNALALSD
jgi:hypothetical protein